MRAHYLPYYEKLSPLAPFVFLKDALLTRSKLARTSLFNRQRDYLSLQKRPELLPLHRELNQILLESASWGSLDYGYGYFYQGSEALGITGFRHTERRANVLGLDEKVRGKRVLEVGCNSGFLTAHLASTAKSVTSLDINPYLVKMAEATCRHRGYTNVEFFTQPFESFAASKAGGQFDVVVSFANHHTYDQNTQQSPGEYFARCVEQLGEGGSLLFESHTPAIEGPQILEQTFREMERYFTVEDRRTVSYGAGLDAGRTVATARKR